MLYHIDDKKNEFIYLEEKVFINIMKVVNGKFTNLLHKYMVIFDNLKLKQEDDNKFSQTKIKILDPEWLVHSLHMQKSLFYSAAKTEI